MGVGREGWKVSLVVEGLRECVRQSRARMQHPFRLSPVGLWMYHGGCEDRSNTDLPTVVYVEIVASLLVRNSQGLCSGAKGDGRCLGGRTTSIACSCGTDERAVVESCFGGTVHVQPSC